MIDGDQTQIYFHVRVLIGVVLALALSRILTGIPRFVEQARDRPGSAIHLLWTGTVFLMAIHFWWFEYSLITVQTWRFELFLFILFYASLFLMMASILVPDSIGMHRNYLEYFMARRRWFFALLAATVPADLLDTLLKGTAHFQSLGFEYPLRLVCLVVLCAIAAWTKSRRFHVLFAALYLAYYLSWVIRLFDVLQ